MSNKKYNFVELLKEYNTKYEANSKLNKVIKCAMIDITTLVITYTHQSGSNLPIKSKKSLTDFIYYYTSPCPNNSIFKKLIQSKLDKDMKLKIEILPSNKIKYAYLSTNYYACTGQLGSSCMRHKDSQRSLNFYIKNNVQIVVVTDNKNKIHARALLWGNVKSRKLKKPFVYLDRVYSRSDTLLGLFKDLVKENSWKSYGSTSAGKSRYDYYVDNLNIEGMCHFPYTDTFRYLYYKDFLVMAAVGNTKVKYPSCSVGLTAVTNGGYVPNLDHNRVEEVFTGNYISKKDAIFIKRYSGWVLKRNIANINGDYYSTQDSLVIQTNADGWILKKNSVTEIFTNNIIDKERAEEVPKYKGFVHKSNVICIRDEIYHKGDCNIICFANKWYHISECFINYNREEANKELEKWSVTKKWRTPRTLFWEDLPESYMQSLITTWSICRGITKGSPGVGVERKDPPIPKKHAIIAYNLVCVGMSNEKCADSSAEDNPKFKKAQFLKTCNKDDIEYQEVYITDKRGTTQLITGELIINSHSNRQYLKKFNNKWYIKKDFEAPDKNQLKFSFMEK